MGQGQVIAGSSHHRAVQPLQCHQDVWHHRIGRGCEYTSIILCIVHINYFFVNISYFFVKTVCESYTVKAGILKRFIFSLFSWTFQISAYLYKQLHPFDSPSNEYLAIVT